MYHNPRRPYYNYRTENTPAESSMNTNVGVIESNRFWKLVKQLTQRQQDAKDSREDKKASAG
jgi:hypothetical protein